MGVSGHDYPFSQLVGTQAVLNVLMGERYKTATDEASAMYWGTTENSCPVNPNVLDKMLHLPEARTFKLAATQPSIARLRKEIGRPTSSDDELLLGFSSGGTCRCDPGCLGDPDNLSPGHKPVLCLLQGIDSAEGLHLNHCKKGISNFPLQKTALNTGDSFYAFIAALEWAGRHVFPHPDNL